MLGFAAYARSVLLFILFRRMHIFKEITTYIYICIYICIKIIYIYRFIYIYIYYFFTSYIYIYIQRERERLRYRSVYLYCYIYIFIYMLCATQPNLVLIGACRQICASIASYASEYFLTQPYIGKTGTHTKTKCKWK